MGVQQVSPPGGQKIVSKEIKKLHLKRNEYELTKAGIGRATLS